MIFSDDFPEGSGPLNFIHKRITGAIGGFIGGGPGGAVRGFIGGGGNGGRPPKPGRAVSFVEVHPSGARHTHFVDDPRAPAKGGFITGGVAPRGFAPSGGDCPAGRVRFLGTCIDIPGGADRGPLLMDPSLRGDLLDAGGVAVVGGFGIPAMTPAIFTRAIRSCGPGMVLGTDELCYPKSVLQRRNKHRKWRGAPRPIFSAADGKIIRKAERLRDDVKDLNKAVGLRVPSKRTKAS